MADAIPDAVAVALAQQANALRGERDEARQQRDEARTNVVRMAQTKVGERCEHHRESLEYLEFLAVRECPICWMSAAQNSEALYRLEKANAEAAESALQSLQSAVLGDTPQMDPHALCALATAHRQDSLDVDATEAKFEALQGACEQFKERCNEIRNGSPNAFYAHVDRFCKLLTAPPVPSETAEETR